MKAIGSKIIVKTNSSGETVKEKSGLYLNTNDVSTHETAVVISVGEEIKADLKNGDTVLIYKGAGHEIKVDEEKLRVISISDILAKEDGKDN